MGKYNRTYTAGLRWKWPFIEKESKVKISKRLFYIAHNIISNDNVCMTIQIIVKYWVNDARKMLLEYKDFSDIIDELVKVELNPELEGLNFEDYKNEKARQRLEKLRTYINDTKKSGIYLDSLSLGDVRLEDAEVWLKEIKSNPILKQLIKSMFTKCNKEKKNE